MMTTASIHPQRRRRHQPAAATARTIASNQKTDADGHAQRCELRVGDRIQAPGPVENCPGEDQGCSRECSHRRSEEQEYGNRSQSAGRFLWRVLWHVEWSGGVE